MNQTFTKILFASPWMLGVSLFLGGNAIAAESSVSAENQKPQAQVSEQPVASISNNKPGQLAQFAPMQLAQVPANPTSSNSMGSIVPASPSMQTGQSGQKNGTMSQMPSVSQLSAGQTPKTGAMSQVTSVSQLSDVQPTDWAFQALQSLVERYGCIAGYPDGTFKGNRALSRFEFAAGLNACLDQLTRQVGAATANFVTKDDLAILQRLQEEFAAELTSLRGRIDVLDARTTELEANQFSTTTKLTGDAIFALSDTWGNRATPSGSKGQKDNTNTTLSDVVRLNFNTSFTGQDLLRTRLKASNIVPFDGSSKNGNLTGTSMTRLSFDGDNKNTFALDKLWYRFPAGQNAIVYVGPMGLGLDDVADVVTPFNNDGQGSISRFGRRNPAIFRGRDGAGGSLTYKFSDGFKVQVAYLANDATASNPSAGQGFFNSGYTALGQFVFTNKNFDLGLAYAHKYGAKGDASEMSATGSFFANRPFRNAATTSENVGLQFNWKLSPGFQFGGWAGYTKANQKSMANLQNGKDATILNGALTLAFPDLFAKGNLGGLIIGVPPKVTSSNFYNTDGTKRKDNSTSLHLEAFYRVQVSDFVSVTPGVFVITNPDHNSKNSSEVVGTLRTTFSF
jgi:hypothetical protein